MHKADSVVVTMSGNDGQFEPHPEGTFLARCVDVVDLGENVEQFENNPPKLVRKTALVFVTGEFREYDGKPELYTLTKEFNVSFGEKANLRKFAEAWRGKRYKDTELTNGIDIGKMAGQFAQISVEHVTTRKNRIFANIASISPVMKGTTLPSHLGAEYQRPSYLTEKKVAYAAAAGRFRADIGAPPSNDFTAAPKQSSDDSLPFD
jgi:hypothetical protein